MAREKELSKVTISKEDVDLIADEMEISKARAERVLREHHGNVVDALAFLTN
jgi:NACalpha-BTF3-like transcription factor